MNLIGESFFDLVHLIEAEVRNPKTVHPLFWHSSEPDRK